VYVEELQKNKELNASLLKEIRDGKTLSNEIMFGTSRDIEVNAKTFILSNSVPSFKTDNGIASCLKQLQFNNKFLKEGQDEYEKVGVVKGYLKADKALADKLKGEYFMALLRVLLKSATQYCVEGKLHDTPAFYADKARQTCDQNDEIKTFFEEEIVENSQERLSKEQLLKVFPNKEIIVYLKSKGYEYDKGLKFPNTNYKRGGWKGIQLNENIEDEEEC
jgi:phage/plasmid-associated DNA primase